jgi:hypothetical protein
MLQIHKNSSSQLLEKRHWCGKIWFLTDMKIAGKLFDPPRTWISLNKLGQANYTYWANGEPLTYTDWGPGNPAQFTSENCAGFE